MRTFHDNSLAMYINLAKLIGCRVFSNPEAPTFIYYSDGVNIGYCQFNREGVELVTVHKPNRYSGTGFQYAKSYENGDATAMMQCMLRRVPDGFSDIGLEKWRDLQEFLDARHGGGAGLVEV